MRMMCPHCNEHAYTRTSLHRALRTRKLRREFLEVRYRALIDGLYAGAADIACEIAVTYQDGRQGALRATVVATDIEGTHTP